MDMITSEIMLRKGFHLSLHVGEQIRGSRFVSQRQNSGSTMSQPSFGKGMIFISAKCYREVRETKY